MQDDETVSAPAASKPAATSAVAVRAVEKSYGLGEERILVLRGLSIFTDPGEMVAIMGPSGSGKTTLLNCISGIDRPDAGSVEIDGVAVDYDSVAARTQLRRNAIGMVFQFFNLVPTLTVRENVALPFLIAGRRGGEAETRIDALIERVGLAARAGHHPYQLSGGEMQLASIARALVHRPRVVLADEPTGNVNPAVGRSIMKTLRAAAREEGASMLLVTHSPEHAAWADRVCFLKDGVIAGEHDQGGRSDDARPIHEKLLALGI